MTQGVHAKTSLPTPTTSANLGAVGDFGTTTVRSEIFQQEGNFWVWAYRDPETGAVVAEEKYRVAEVDSASEGGTRLKIDIAAREGGGGSGEEPWETYHRVDMDLGDALEMHEDLDDEPHWDFRGFYRRRDPEADGEATQAPAAPTNQCTSAPLLPTIIVYTHAYACMLASTLCTMASSSAALPIAFL